MTFKNKLYWSYILVDNEIDYELVDS